MEKLTKMFEGNEVTIITEGNELYFRLGDVCEVLGLSNTRMVRARLDDDVSSTYPIQDRLGRAQQATFVNEDGLYDVILDSRKPEAKRFRKWITSEVLPSIRKHGAYMTNSVIQEIQSNPEVINFLDRKSTRLNSSHVSMSYAVFC